VDKDPVKDSGPEKIKGNPRYCFFLISAALVFVFISYRWFFPWLSDYTKRSLCEEVFGINGTIVLFSAIFIVPGLLVLLVTLWMSYYSYRVIKAKQDPPPNAFVCRDTVPTWNRWNKIRAYIALGLPVIGIGLVIMGAVLFAQMKRDVIDPALVEKEKKCVQSNSTRPK
jgi:hypothetical protein